MSTRIVDASVKKPESVKSSKAVINTGYELLGHAKGKKFPDASGYHKPDTRAVGGYELVRSPAGKKTGAVHNMEIFYVRPVDEKVEQSKRDPILIVAVLILTLFGIVAIISIAVVFFVPEQEPLPDLNELCRQEQDLDQFKGVDRYCFFHRDKYPKNNCTGTTCSSVVYTLKIDNGKVIRTHLSREEIRLLLEIPNQTPCAPGKWCQDGQCVKTDDERENCLMKLNRLSVWINTCNKPKCIFIHNRSILNYFGNCTIKKMDDCRNYNGLPFVVFGFRHASPPKHNGEYRPKNDWPIHAGKKCGSCPGNATSLKRECRNSQPDTGFPCKKGFCFLGKCVVGFSADQNCSVD